MRSTFLFLSMAVVSGCISETGVQAPTWASLNIPEDVQLAWDINANGIDDGIGSVILLDFFVNDDSSASEFPAPMPDIKVEVLSNWLGLYVIPQSAVRVVDYPTEPEVDCDDPELWDPDSCPWYDISNGDYYEFSSAYGAEYKPNYIVAPTDSRGMLRTYVYVDALPTDSTGEEAAFSEVTLWVSIGHDSGVVAFTVDN